MAARMTLRIAPCLLPFLLLFGCATPAINPAASTSHPANPDAPEAPIPPPSMTLSTTPPTTEQSMPGMNMDQDMENMSHEHHHH
jgi:hypothetical protein